LALIEACVLGHQGPKALDHAPGQPTDWENVDPASNVVRRYLPIWLRQGALGQEDEDFSGGYAFVEQRLEVLGGRVVLPVPTGPSM
jgi:hypothetical protein